MLLLVIFVNVWLLATALVPLHEPDALQVVALVLLHVNVTLPPDTTLLALVFRVTVGTVPPTPGVVTTMTTVLFLPPQVKV